MPPALDGDWGAAIRSSSAASPLSAIAGVGRPFAAVSGPDIGKLGRTNDDGRRPLTKVPVQREQEPSDATSEAVQHRYKVLVGESSTRPAHMHGLLITNR